MGYGPQAFIQGESLIPYRINFENLGPGSEPAPAEPATVAAQRVVITDQLSEDLDWSTLRFTGFGFGDNYLSVPAGRQYHFATVPTTYEDQTFDVEIELSFDSATGEVGTVFQSINPDTFLPPEGLAGFLPPEDGSGNGKGYISFDIQAKADLPTGTEIRNVALIIFDGQEIIATNQVDPQDPTKGTDPTKEALQTIDAGAASSRVLDLPAAPLPEFEVSWTGTDDEGGSGIAAFDIYVSIDSGPYELWLENTVDTSATYAGVSGRTYSFYSQATDNVGHLELAPTTADATTTPFVNAPVAQDGTAAATEDGSPVAGQLLADDIDSDDTPETLIYALVDEPSEGTATVSSDGSFTFHPGSDFQYLAADETRDVNFTFQATDRYGEVSNVANMVVTVTGVNDVPVAQDGTAAAEDGDPVAGQLLANDVDSDDTAATLIYALVSGPSEGNATVNSDGSFTFDPGRDFQDLAADETRDVTFTFEATDRHGEVSNVAKVVVTVTGADDSTAQPEDVTDRVATNFYGRQYNRRTGVYGFYASITNNADAQLVDPIRLLLTELGPAGTTVENAHGTLEDGTPYFDFAGTAALAPGETTEAVVIAIKPPSRTRLLPKF